MIVELFYYSFICSVIILILILIIIIVLYSIIYFTFFITLVKASYFFYQEHELKKFIKRNSDYYLDVFFNEKSNISMFNKKLECIKLDKLNEVDLILGNYYYKDLNGIRGMINKNDLKYLKTSLIYDEYDNWNDMKYKLSLPRDVLIYISKFIADKKCLKKERSIDIKYFDNV